MSRLMRHVVRRLLPATLFGRLAILLMAFALASHALALTALFELMPGPPPGSGRPPPLMPGPPPLMPAGMALDIGVRLAALTLAAWIAAAWISRPIKRLASAAQALGQSMGRSPDAPLPEGGPLECREASRVFNRMQTQIHGHLQERDRLVAAVSHDLRTPLTRLRLRTEDLADAAQRARFQHDIAEMEQMVGATLDYMRGAASSEAHVLLDVQALVQSMCDDQQACGHLVHASGQAAALHAAPSALRRCLGNLVDNAVRYGGSAHIVLADSEERLEIQVRDRGPGIPAAELGKVLQPFYRVEGSRNRLQGGVGLGLAIAHDIARQHQGQLSLCNAPTGGLVASLSLPR